MLAQTLRGPHNLYRRYQAQLETVATALGLALVVTFYLNSLMIYPPNWTVVVGIALVVLGAWMPMAALTLAAAVLLYPIYLINFYLAVLFLALSVLGHRIFVHYLGATVLVMATPLLAEYHLHWLVPILAGLWWGNPSAVWVGGLGATWGKIVGGMAGLNIDWLVMAGEMVNVREITTRFAGANSLETLLLLVEPFAAESTIMLYNILQIVGWMIAAGVVGALAQRDRVKYSAPWSVFVLTASGGLILLITHLGLPYWLSDAVTKEAQTVIDNPLGPLFSLLTVIVIGTIVYTLRESLELPVAPPKLPRIRSKSPRQKQSPVTRLRNLTQKGSAHVALEKKQADGPRQPVRVPDYSELPEWEPPKDKSGLIMLEID